MWLALMLGRPRLWRSRGLGGLRSDVELTCGGGCGGRGGWFPADFISSGGGGCDRSGKLMGLFLVRSSCCSQTAQLVMLVSRRSEPVRFRLPMSDCCDLRAADEGLCFLFGLGSSSESE